MMRLATPGVYIEEKNAFGSSVVGLPTAVPAFLGYTEKAERAGKSLLFKPTRITTLGEFIQYFGGAAFNLFNIETAAANAKNIDFTLAGKNYVLTATGTRFMLYDALRMFFANGGSTCYIVSVGSYTNDDGSANAPTKKAFEDGITSLIAEEEPTLLVTPEAVLLEEADCQAIQQAALQHCGGKMKNRFAVLDVYGGYVPRTYDETDVVTRFREGVGTNYLNYGAAYYPWVNASVVSADELSFKNIGNIDVLAEVLTKEADIINENPKKATEIKAEITKLSDDKVNANNLNQTLKTVCPLFKLILSQMQVKLNLLPPSAAMVGIFTMVDTTRGVFKAPANVSMSNVIAPAVKMTNDDQEDLNVTVTGKSVNGIRSFIGEGTVVWGARTLDGNSQDWRYINVRRTLIFIEQSIKYAAKRYVYEPNDAGTWVLIKGTITGFLTTLWKAGGLVGVTPEQAFEVAVGIGQTMTPTDVLDGVMRITVKVAVSRPAEFIVITFQQKMQES
jgi:hypothetical protein